MNELEKKLLQHAAFTDAKHAAARLGAGYDAVMSTIARLEEEGLLQAKRESKTSVQLTAEGEECLAKGSPEARLAAAVKKHGGKATIQQAATAANLSQRQLQIALQWAMRKKFLVTAKDASGATVLHTTAACSDETQTTLRKAAFGKELSEEEKETLFSRRLAELREEKTVFFKATEKGMKEGKGKESAEVSQLTSQLLKSGEWKQAVFKPYDLATVAAPVRVARKQAYREFLQRVKENLVGMGFAEVHGPLVELEFWNMDALFMAQDHPAREIHDVFKLQGKGDVVDRQLVGRVKKAHEGGLSGSKGWRYEWNPEVAMQLVLRSQTTAVSARHLAAGLKPPARLFCIGRVFRPDEIDWKHFIEFNQCEGIVLDEGMTFRELLGYLKTFATEVFGAKECKFIPHYYPFTEPSVDLAVKLEGRGWMEVGGAGMFRPEMLAGLGIEHPVLAWGLGIDRLALIKLGITDLRDLFTTDLQMLSSR